MKLLGMAILAMPLLMAALSPDEVFRQLETAVLARFIVG